LENLKPWKPGQSGNPSGRPKQPLSDAIRRILNRKFNSKQKKRLGSNPTVADKLAHVLVFEVGIDAKDVGAIREIGDRIEGKPNQRIELSGTTDGPPIQVNTEDLSQLSNEELLQYRALKAKTARRHT